MFALLGATTVGQLVRKGLQCSSSWDEQSFAGLSEVTLLGTRLFRLTSSGRRSQSQLVQ